MSLAHRDISQSLFLANDVGRLKFWEDSKVSLIVSKIDQIVPRDKMFLERDGQLFKFSYRVFQGFAPNSSLLQITAGLCLWVHGGGNLWNNLDHGRCDLRNLMPDPLLLHLIISTVFAVQKQDCSIRCLKEWKLASRALCTAYPIFESSHELIQEILVFFGCVVSKSQDSSDATFADFITGCLETFMPNKSSKLKHLIRMDVLDSDGIQENLLPVLNGIRHFVQSFKKKMKENTLSRYLGNLSLINSEIYTVVLAIGLFTDPVLFSPSAAHTEIERDALTIALLLSNEKVMT